MTIDFLHPVSQKGNRCFCCDKQSVREAACIFSFAMQVLRVQISHFATKKTLQMQSQCRFLTYVISIDKLVACCSVMDSSIFLFSIFHIVFAQVYCSKTMSIVSRQRIFLIWMWGIILRSFYIQF